MNKALLACTVAVVTGCATGPRYEQIESQPITNALGHVIGQREILREESSGERIEKVAYYSPRYDAKGAVVAYEEVVPDGVVIRSLNGRRIGVRYNDLRSSGSNPGSAGITVIVPGVASE